MNVLDKHFNDSSHNVSQYIVNVLEKSKLEAYEEEK